MYTKTLLAITLLFSVAGCAGQQTAATPSTPSAAQGIAGEIVLEDGTPVRLRLTQTISSKKAKTGDRVTFEAFEEIIAGSSVVIPRHAAAWGTISKAQPSRMLGRGGKLFVQIEGINAVTGELVRLRGAEARKGNPGVGLGDVIIAGATVVLLPALPFIKGDQAVVKKGSKIEAYVNGNMSFDKDVLRQSLAVLEAKSNSPVLMKGGKAIVHLYRPALTESMEDDSFRGTFSIQIDGTELVRLRAGRFVTVRLDPGKHTFGTDISETEIALEKENEYYIRAAIKIGLPPKGEMLVVGNEQGEDEMYPLEPSNAKDIKNRAIVAVETRASDTQQPRPK